MTKSVNEALATYRFHEAANSIYDFFWGEFCDWYIELIKPRLMAENDRQAAATACANLVQVFEASLRLLHPVMPFITEEIWQAMYDGAPPLKSIALAAYPQADDAQMDLQAETDMAVLQDLIVSVRNLRAELKVEPKVKVPIEVFAHDAETRRLIEENRGAVERLAQRGAGDASSRPRAPNYRERGARRDLMSTWYMKGRLTSRPSASA